jgi:hypothetical protein
MGELPLWLDDETLALRNRMVREVVFKGQLDNIWLFWFIFIL